MATETQTDVTRTRENSVDEQGAAVQTERVVRREDRDASASGVAQNIIYLLYGLLVALLAFRLLFSLLGANTANAFANFIYTVTGPFVGPFRSLFSVDTTIGDGTNRFELETVVAVLVYGLLAWLLVKVVRIKKDAPQS